MTKDDAIKAIEGLMRHRPTVREEPYNYALHNAIEAIRALPDAGWRDISTAPQEVVVVGLKKRLPDEGAAFFIGKPYDMRPNALIDIWSGRWAVCSHFMPLPQPPEKA